MTLNTSSVERGSFNIIAFLSPLNHEWSWVRLLNSCLRALLLIGASPGEQEADALLACVTGRTDVLEHRWVIVLDAGVQFWPRRNLSHPGNGWVTCIKSWNCPHLLTPSLMENENSGAMDGSRALQWRYFISWTKARFGRGTSGTNCELWFYGFSSKRKCVPVGKWLTKKMYETPFNNFNFWKQFRGQVGSVWLPRKGTFFLLFGCRFFFFQLYNMYTKTVLTYGKYYESTEEHLINALIWCALL